MTKKKLLFLKKKACEIRMHIIDEVYSAQSGHPGGSLSAADIITYLYFDKMNIDPADSKMENRDRFVLSKGHSCPALYAALAERGFFSVDELTNYRRLGCFLQGHPEMNGINGVDMSTGSLGQGVSAACGMALCAKRTGKPYRVYTVLGDGELQEGQVWEAAMFAAHYKLDNLTAFVDFNHLQIDGDVREVMNPTPIDQKFLAFGWNVVCVSGHDFEALESAVLQAEATSERPTAIICTTVKGKGVSFMENVAGWHGKAPDTKLYENAKAELAAAFEKLSKEEA